ncbi:MAG: DUF547 domain-containing protein [Acidobacteria bacterium]|nr:DUF547 domain-containing protein [Acidobacteriota bacterium]
MKSLAQFACVLASAHVLMAAPGTGPDPSKWEAVLKKYVNAEARVDYGGLKQHGLGDLDGFLREVAAPWPAGIEVNTRKAALINAYNALTVRWIVTNYPVESIMKTPNPFKAQRHAVDGRTVSLDQVESELRAIKDPRIHAALVCAARSCPALRREAYVAERLEVQLDDNTRAWLANSQLNEFLPDRGLASVSPIFKWYGEDFGSAKGLSSFLARHAPDGRGTFLLSPGARIEFKDYGWGLNDASTLGGGYSRWNLYWDLAIHNPTVRWAIVGAIGVLIGGSFWWLGRRRAKARNVSGA